MSKHSSAEKLPRDNSLTAKQINYAIEAIEDRRALQESSLGTVWPFLRYICCCCFSYKRSFKSGLKRALRRKLDMKVSKSDERIEKDPYLLLGYGMPVRAALLISEAVFLCVFVIFCACTRPAAGWIAQRAAAGSVRASSSLTLNVSRRRAPPQHSAADQRA